MVEDNQSLPNQDQSQPQGQNYQGGVPPQSQHYQSQTSQPSQSSQLDQTFQPDQQAYQPQQPQQSQQFRSNQQFQEQVYYPETNRPLPEQVVYEWSAPARPFKKRNRQYYITIALIVFLVSMILFFAGQFLPIAVVVSAAFFAYVISSVPPQEAQLKITTYGIRFDDTLYYWEELGRFWDEERYNQRVIQIELGRFPNRITLVVGQEDEAEVKDILAEVLLYEKPPLTSIEKGAKWLSDKIPLE